ncbi:unnamed protein product [Adineta steineri]|uniref:Small EDRK-rich factor-like N-terminal domain-containing protein n=1 Tax=Adineta steineri TaxID=433720 RepID=A0A814RFA3_9BILA|nr:unnamed protein product [Adineta steineri]CAF3911476.1 unnamed protein product [Adineta steineri]
MTRGNQRDLAREKNLKNQKGKGQSAAETEANKGLSLQERQLRDAAKMREKQQLAAQKKSGGNNNTPGNGGLLTLGDFCAQFFHEKKTSLDDKRLLAACLTGTAMGTEGHIWYKFLDRAIVQATWHNVFKKVVLDQTIAAPIYTMTYIIGTSVLEGRTSSRELKNDIKANFLPLYIADCVIFIPVQIINFRYISKYYRVPFMFSISFVFNYFLSVYKHRQQ